MRIRSCSLGSHWGRFRGERRESAADSPGVLGRPRSRVPEKDKSHMTNHLTLTGRRPCVAVQPHASACLRRLNRLHHSELAAPTRPPSRLLCSSCSLALNPSTYHPNPLCRHPRSPQPTPALAHCALAPCCTIPNSFVGLCISSSFCASTARASGSHSSSASVYIVRPRPSLLASRRQTSPTCDT